jgi:outer membrane protein assembly factor BamB
MQVDFQKTAADHLTVYKSLCSVPGNDAEEQARKAKFYRLVGQGREAEGNLVEAFQMYKDFGALGKHKDEGVPSVEDPNQKIPVNVWLRGRISGMLAKAPLAQKEPLEVKIAAEWKAVEAKKDLDAIRSFVGMFDIPVRVGREARVQLAETIMDRNERAAFLEAEMSLHQVLGSEFKNDPLTGGRALAALAQLEEKKGTIDSMRLAAVYYRRLGRDFADAKVRGNKTGKDLINELGTDKRFLAFLEESTSTWGPVKLAARDIPAGQFQVGMSGFVMLPHGDDTPFARQHRVMLDPSDTTNPRVRLRDATSNQDRWMTNLGHVPMNQQIFFHLYQQAGVNQAYHPNARFRFYHVKGHLVVCQVGVMVYCLDGDTGKKLWEMQTVENIANNGLISLQSVTSDFEGNPEFLYWNQLTNQRFTVALGRIGTAQASYVAVLGHKGLTVVDPLRGTVMWKKSDVSINSHVFGDDQYLFLAEANQNGAIGAGRTLRANDGEALNIQDFSNVYQNRIRVVGRQILAAQSSGAGVTIRLYDILSAKDVWSHKFAQGARVLTTEDHNITGILEPNGTLTVLEAETGKQLVSTTILQGRVAAANIKTLAEPLLLQDAERFYVALNEPVQSGRVAGGLLHNNFNNGTRCLTVNGWFVAIHREAGSKKLGEREIKWKKGDLAWHSYNPVKNQMIVLDQFENSPIVVFTTRYNEILPNGGNRWVSVTESYHKGNGKMIYDSGPRNINGFSPTFTVFQTDLKTRTINLIGFSGSVQHYVDDGKAPPPVPGAMRNPGNPFDATTEQARILRGAINQDVGQKKIFMLPPDGLLPGDRERILRALIDPLPIDLPPISK